MFQTFSGSSRRPRQVNLSGQNLNPFAGTSWRPSASGTQQTVAHAQQERLQRQQERNRLDASRKIQRIWRGHRSRRDLANMRRIEWDQLGTDNSQIATGVLLLSLSKLLVSFYDTRRQDDYDRIVKMSLKIVGYGCAAFLASEGAQPLLVRLAWICLQALKKSLPQCPPSLLQILVAIVNRRPQLFAGISEQYYALMSQLSTTKPRIDQGLLLTALRIPLTEHIDLNNCYEMIVAAYASFALYFLATPDLARVLGRLNELASMVDVGLLSTALVQEYSSSRVEQIGPERRLWLLAHLISLHRLKQKAIQEPEYLRALSLQLSACSGDILGRVDSQAHELIHETPRNVQWKPLPSFIQDELLSLVNQESISGLLTKFDLNYAKGSAAGEEDTSLLSSYALTLLRIFSRRGDEIRMWLYLGSMTIQNGVYIPALKFFWHTMRSTNIFSAIKADTKAAFTILRPAINRGEFSEPFENISEDRDWCTILLFLELYAFVLRFTDDEEFLTGCNLGFGQGALTSRIQESALPLEEIKQLTLFLKNLAFTAYYYAAKLADDGPIPGESTIGSYFGNKATSISRSKASEATSKSVLYQPFAGIAGMSFGYVRTLATGVMRMLYERDSRRQFLPKDHWLMTSRFDMEGFIPAVVMEEERRHDVREEDDEDDPDDTHFIESRYGSHLVGMARPRRTIQIENMRKAQQKLARQKVLAAVGPRLEVLQNMPFVIPFETRVKIFREFVSLDQIRRRGGNVDPDMWRVSIMQQSAISPRNDGISGHELLGRHHAKIRRDQVFDDAFDQFYSLGEGLKEPIQITFVDQFDTVEAGIDGGGVTKEFLTSITNEAFRPGEGPTLFTSNEQNLLFPNPAAVDERKELLRQAGFSESDPEWGENLVDLCRRFEFLGRIVGKCLYEGILVDIGFAGFFLLKWAASGAKGPESGYRANINDLRDFDEGLYQGLLKLKNFSGDVEGFSLDFTIVDTITLPGTPVKTIVRELKPNGSNIPVTNENRPLYVSYVARHRLQVQPYQQTQHFLKGLSEIINPSWLSMFNQSELQILIGGDSSEIDVEDLRRNTLYGGVYQIGDDGQEHDTVKLFWKVMKALDDPDRRKVLKYVTSTPRAPLLGFSQLKPRFSIRDAGSDEERLPSTSTCVNLLKLPRYSAEALLKHKLLYAINAGAGFDLS